MKFIHYLEKVSNVGLFGLLSLIISLAFFTVMLVWVFKTKEKNFREISRIPLDN